MNKGNKLYKIGRNREQRKALLRSLSNDLITRGSITTTEAKAKALKPFIERMVNHAKKGSLASRRYGLRFLTQGATNKLFDEIAPSYADRVGGYTRIIKAPVRTSDISKMAIIELVK
ncbi:50S ribosomal protein L17 [bacterium]|nr:50S ribosomal protein L17 [Candidatus Elulimicrobium humile]